MHYQMTDSFQLWKRKVFQWIGLDWWVPNTGSVSKQWIRGPRLEDEH